MSSYYPFLVTVALQAEVALLFIAAGIAGILYYGSLFRRRRQARWPPSPRQSRRRRHRDRHDADRVQRPPLGKLLAFFLKAGSLTFGSGLVIVPFLEKGLVQETGWLDPREFLVAVAIGMFSPGPVVITATFVGYLVAGFWGSLVSTIGIFLPSFLLILIVAPILLRHRGNPNVQGFVKGRLRCGNRHHPRRLRLLGKIAIGDWLTALIAVSLARPLFRFKVSNPLFVGVTARRSV